MKVLEREYKLYESKTVEYQAVNKLPKWNKKKIRRVLMKLLFKNQSLSLKLIKNFEKKKL